MKAQIKNYAGQEFEIEVYYDHRFKGRGSWNIECTVSYLKSKRTIKTHTTNSMFIDEINGMKADHVWDEEIQDRYFEAFFDEKKEIISEWIDEINEEIEQDLKEELAQWLVDENDDCGKDTYFSEDPRGAMTTEESLSKFMEDYSKEELIDLIYNFSDEGQKFIEDKKLVND